MPDHDDGTLAVQPFRPEDVQLLMPQHQQMSEMISIGDWRVMVQTAAEHGPAWTGWRLGQVLGVAGVTLRWPGRAHAWCVLAPDIPKAAWLSIHRAVLARLPQMRALGIVRLEAETMRGFPQGDRWLRLLGFEFEGVMRCYGPGGQDFGRYARIDP